MTAAAPYAFGVNTYSYMLTHSAWDCMAHLAVHGVRSFELMAAPGHLWPSEMPSAACNELCRRVAGEGLCIHALNMPSLDINYTAAAPEMRAYSVSLTADLVRLAGMLGASSVLIAPGKANPLFAPPQQQLADHFYAALDVLHPVACDAGVRLLIENLPISIAPDADRLMRLVDGYGRDDIEIVYDVANGWFIGEDLGLALARVRPRLGMVHFSDTSQRAWRHDPVGEGTVPFGDVPAVLRRLEYRGAKTLEIISHQADVGVLGSMAKLATLNW